MKHRVGPRADGSDLRRIYVSALAAVMIVACTASISSPTESAPVPPTTRSFSTAYYIESQQVEPWGPTAGGEFPNDWESHAKQDLSAAGLHPQTVGQRDFRTTMHDPIICAGCPSGFVMFVVLPIADLTRAAERCFVLSEPDFNAQSTTGNRPASKRTDCRPLYPPK